MPAPTSAAALTPAAAPTPASAASTPASAASTPASAASTPAAPTSAASIPASVASTPASAASTPATAPTAIVTGAGSGIGAAVTQGLLERGWRVALAGRREETLRDTLAQAAGINPSDDGDRALAIPTDVTDPPAVARLFDTVQREWGRLDLLFNNAGLFGRPTPVEELSLEAWQQLVDVNLTGSFLCARHAFAAMKAQRPQGGRIVNNGSISAQTPRPHALPYTATKHAITGLTKGLALEGRVHHIACGQIDVGNAATELTAGIRQGALQADGSVVGEPMMDVRHAADAVLYMAQLPLEANVLFLTVTATGMPFVGRG